MKNIEKKIYEKPMVAIADIELEPFCAASGDYDEYEWDETLSDEEVDGEYLL